MWPKNQRNTSKLIHNLTIKKQNTFVTMLRHQLKLTRVFDLPIYWLVYFCLVCYSFLLVPITKDFGFQADDFWILSAPFSNGFWQAFIEYALPWDRPLGLVYVFSLFKLFGFSRIPYFAFDLLLQATTGLIFGMAISKVFPDQRRLVFFCMLFSFFLLPSSSSLYMMAMTVARLGALLFWLSVLVFQWWAKKPTWARLLIPVLIYWASTLSYDSTSVLIITVPIFVYPVWYWHHKNDETSLINIYAELFAKIRLSLTGKVRLFHQPELEFLLRMLTGILVCVGLLFINLFILFPFGAVRIRSYEFSFSLALDYVLVFLKYLITPFTYHSVDVGTWMISILLLVLLSITLFRSRQPQQTSNVSTRRAIWPNMYAALLGLLLSILGILPFIMARYGAGVGFTGHGRIYFSAVYGFALLLSIIIAAWKGTRFRWFMEWIGIIVIVASAGFLADLRLDWRSAVQKNCALWSSMIEQVPAVKNDTAFLFLNLQSYYQNGEIVPIGNRAVVFAGVDALPLYLQMLYGNDTLRGYYLYSPEMEQSILQSEGRIAIVTADDVMARGSLELPKDKILILERQGVRLVLLDKLTAADGKAAIVWKDGVNELVSNHDLITSGDVSFQRFETIWGHVCR